MVANAIIFDGSINESKYGSLSSQAGMHMLQFFVSEKNSLWYCHLFFTHICTKEQEEH